VRVASLGCALVLALAGCGSPAAAPPPASSSAPPASSSAPAAEELGGVDALEATYGARVGVWALDTGTGQVVEHRAGERFAHASTLKLLLVGLLLDRATDAELDAVVPITADDVLEYAPVTSQHVGTGLPLREVMAAAITVSDNTAANLLVEQLGGPAQVQAALRDLGNPTTRVDRVEPDLNEATPGDPRDTSTPADLGASVQQLVLGDVLAPDRRALLQQWLRENTTGDAAIRAGVPAGWEVGDKTGSGGYGTRNDVGVVEPDDGGAPLVVVLLTDRGVPDADTDDALLADATRLVVDQLSR
jgi:beta-lactamase class A